MACFVVKTCALRVSVDEERSNVVKIGWTADNGTGEVWLPGCLLRLCCCQAGTGRVRFRVVGKSVGKSVERGERTSAECGGVKTFGLVTRLPLRPPPPPRLILYLWFDPFFIFA